jgi:large subunit ribosomal protein L29
MVVGSKELAPVELDTFENDRLVDELKKAKEELFNLRFQSATGQLESHGRLRAVKRDIARIYTVIRERELGIRATPVVTEAPAKAPKKAAAEKAEKPAKAEADEKPATAEKAEAEKKPAAAEKPAAKSTKKSDTAEEASE